MLVEGLKSRSWRIAYLVLLFSCLEGTANALLSREEALTAAFPGAAIKLERLFLTDQQRQQVELLAKVDVPSALIARYSAVIGSKSVGRAYVDTHIVRSKKQSLLICLDEEGKVKRIEATAFLEPAEYLASPSWYGQYRGRTLSNDLHLQRSIRSIAGATLTARATNQAVRRVLAVDWVLRRHSERVP